MTYTLLMPLRQEPWPKGPNPYTLCPICQERWRPWAGSYLPCHAACLFSLEDCKAMYKDKRTGKQIAKELGVTLSVIYAARYRGSLESHKKPRPKTQPKPQSSFSKPTVSPSIPHKKVTKPKSNKPKPASANQVIQAAEEVVRAFSRESDQKVMLSVIKLEEMLNRWKLRDTPKAASLSSLEQDLIQIKLGIELARKACIETINKWEISGESIASLIYKLRTLPIKPKLQEKDS